MRLVTWNVDSLGARLPRRRERLTKLGFVDAARERVAELRRRPLAIARDFNATRADLDVYDPRAFRQGLRPSDHAPLVVDLWG